MIDFKPFTNFSELSIADLDQWQKDGGKIAGVYCVYAPGELIRAAGMVPVGLCGKKQAPIHAAEKDLPASFCPLIKSSYGYAVTDTCPFFAFSDVVIAETTCDGKKKMYELMGRIKPLHLMHLPYTSRGGSALRYWMDSLAELERFVCGYSKQRVTEQNLHDQIVIQNQIKKALYDIIVLAADPCSPVSESQMLAIYESKSFSVSQQAYLENLYTLKEQFENYLAQPDLRPRTGPRVLLTGCPIGKGCEKVIRMIEDLGGRVVCMENCTGLKGLVLPVDETGNPYEALARRYLGIPCSCMTPNDNRLESIRQMAETFKADGVIDLTWLGCHTYNAESRIIHRLVEDDLNLPFAQIETDYSSSDEGQLRTRIEASMELME